MTRPVRVYEDHEWRTASMSGQCIEVLHDDDDNVQIRDSKNRTQVVKCSLGDFQVFVQGAKDGKFDF